MVRRNVFGIWLGRHRARLALARSADTRCVQPERRRISLQAESGAHPCSRRRRSPEACTSSDGIDPRAEASRLASASRNRKYEGATFVATTRSRAALAAWRRPGGIRRVFRRARTRKLMRILLSRTDRIGDLILSTPAIATLRRSFPDAHITLVCSEYNKVVIEGNRDVDAIETLPPGVDHAAFGKKFRGAVDVAIALAPRTADIRLVGVTRARRRIGYTYVSRTLARLAARRDLTDVLISEADPRLADRYDPYPVRHEVLQVLALAERAGATRFVYDLELPVSDADRAAVADLPEGAITVHFAQRWMREGNTFENLIALIAELRVLGRPIVVTYGDEMNEYAQQLSAAGADRLDRKSVV